MKYLWTEDTGAGLHFWKLVNQLFFDDALVVESKESNQGLLDALAGGVDSSVAAGLLSRAIGKQLTCVFVVIAAGSAVCIT